MQKVIKLYKDGQTWYEVYPNGDVFKESVFPISTPGRDFMKQKNTRRLVGKIGEDGNKQVLKNENAQYGPKYHAGKQVLKPFVKNRNSWELLGNLE